MCTDEMRVQPSVVLGSKALLEMLPDILPIDREEVHSLIGSTGKPGKMIDSGYIDQNIMPVFDLVSGLLFINSLQHLLRAKHLVAAAKGFDLRENIVQCLYAKRHRVRVVDDPGIRAKAPDRLCNLHIHRDGTQRTDNSSGACRISDGLIAADTLRQMNIRFHLLKGSRQDGDDDEIAAGQRTLQSRIDLKFPVSLRIFPAHQMIADLFVHLSRLLIQIIQPHLAGDLILLRKVCHQGPGPASGSSSNVCNFQIRYFVVLVNHRYPLWPRCAAGYFINTHMCPSVHPSNCFDVLL